MRAFRMTIKCLGHTVHIQSLLINTNKVNNAINHWGGDVNLIDTEHNQPVNICRRLSDSTISEEREQISMRPSSPAVSINPLCTSADSGPASNRTIAHVLISSKNSELYTCACTKVMKNNWVYSAEITKQKTNRKVYVYAIIFFLGIHLYKKMVKTTQKSIIYIVCKHGIVWEFNNHFALPPNVSSGPDVP